MIQVIPVYGAEEYMALYLKLWEEGGSVAVLSIGAPTPPHMPWSSNSVGSWLSSPKIFTRKVTCHYSWFPGTKECLL